MIETTELDEIAGALRRIGLIEDTDRPSMTPMTGGVSSDIWRVALPDRVFCVKRALAKLKVDADWQAPVGRNAFEVAWFEVAGAFAPDAVPRILAHDPDAGLFAMEYLDARDHRLWKDTLLAGDAERAAGTAVARVLAAIHAGTAGDRDIAARFATDETFYAIRLEPYLEATARVHPDCSDALMALSARTSQTKKTLVHGDVSPKNILFGPSGPVFLDAECAWYGDPAFDVAFCLNHLLLKCLWRPDRAEKYLACFGALARGYLANVDWENPDVLEARIATLLPGLFLARVDGKSPVEYLTDDASKETVRRISRDLLSNPVNRLADVAAALEEELHI